jgi:ATP-dependent DNA helicase DinG
MIKINRPLGVREILSPGGLVAQSFAGFESRAEQVEMACAVKEALTSGRHLAVEAGTGVGKSFAYLIPAIEQVCRGTGKVLVSTFTITLQEQLINKDIPFLAGCMSQGFTAVLAKGRGNYLCRRRLDFATKRGKMLFDEQRSELERISSWVRETQDGSLSDIGFIPSANLWDAVKSEHGNCRGRKCLHFHDCFYRRARRMLDSADIIVANHALMFSDLALKDKGVSLLPGYRFVIIDEAQNIEHVAEEHFGLDISNGRVKFLLDGLYNPRTHKGLLVYAKADDVIDIVVKTAAEARAFFKQVRNWYEETKDELAGRIRRNFVDDTVSEHLKKLRVELAKLAKRADDEDERFEIIRFVDRCEVLVQDIESFSAQERKDYVYWVEISGTSGGAVYLRSAPLNVGPDVRKCLFDKYESVILTSATLSSGATAEKGGFDFFVGRIGLEDFDSLKLGSPFDYEKQVTVYIEKNLPEPNEPDFTAAAAEALKKYLLQTKGRAFVLFTSYSMLEEMAQELANWLDQNNIRLLQQGAGVDRGTLLKFFKAKDASVLFGADSFWQGVDVPGQALSNVIIVRLPFAVPDKPLLAGRLLQITENGGNPFYDYQLPSAIIKFKQGFGRLIRSKSDKGIVVILDSRIVNKSYGRKFLDAIPKCRVRFVSTG